MKRTVQSRKKRVFVIGLDGATFEIIKPMAKEGKLPTFSRLMRQAAYGPLRSTIPPITPCAWTSFATGKDPSKHGLYDFTLHQGDPENKKNVNRTFVKAKSLWRILSEAGKRSIVIDVPLTYPPEEINGIVISRVMAPAKKKCVYPDSLYYTLRRRGFLPTIDRKIAQIHAAPADNSKEELPQEKQKSAGTRAVKPRKILKQKVKRAFRHIVETIERNTALTQWLMSKEDWDFFMIVFMSADHAGHTFWADQKKIRKVYEELDKAVGKLIAQVDDNTTVFIMSDHGFTSMTYAFNINEWLSRKGLLAKKLAVPYKESMVELKRFLKKRRKAAVNLKKKYRLKEFGYRIEADYARSKAYLQSGTCYGIRINLEGRDTTGIVRKQDYEPLRTHLINECKRLRHPASGKKIFSHVLKKEEVYAESPFGLVPAPDIFLLTRGMEGMLRGQMRPGAPLFRKASKSYGFHHIDGILFVKGKNIKRGLIRSAGITDLMPTILHILGVALPSDLDGRVLRQCFKTDSPFAQEAIHFQEPSAVEEENEEFSQVHDGEIKRYLKALGYL